MPNDDSDLPRINPGRTHLKPSNTPSELPSLIPGRHLVQGALQGLLAGALFPVTAIITVSFVTRWLGPAAYGLLLLCVTVVTWLEFTVTSLFGRATIKLIGDAEDWKPIGAKIAYLHLLVSGGAMVLLWILAGPIADLTQEPALVEYLRLLSFDIPILALAACHRHILVGIGNYRGQALSIAGRWLSRMVLTIPLVVLGLSVQGAILGIIGGSIVELAIARFYVRPRLWGSSAFPAQRILSFAAPIFLSALYLRLLRLDLFALKLLGGTVEQVGFYGAAQRVSDVTFLLGRSFLGPLLSTLTRAVRDGQHATAQIIACNMVRFVVMLLPVAAMIAGTAEDIVSIILGPRFAPAAPIQVVLIFGALAIIMIAANQAILIAADKTRLTSLLTAPMVPVALVGHVVMIPPLGAIGAAVVTTTVACLVALASTIAVYRVFGVLPTTATMSRSVLISGMAFGLATLWSTPDFWVLVKLAVISLSIPASYLLLGELSTEEIHFVRSALDRWWVSPQEEEGMT